MGNDVATWQLRPSLGALALLGAEDVRRGAPCTLWAREIDLAAAVGEDTLKMSGIWCRNSTE